MVWIELNDEQVKALEEEEDLVREANEEGHRGGVLGQFYPNERGFEALFVPEEVAVEIINILKRYGIYRKNRSDV